MHEWPGDRAVTDDEKQEYNLLKLANEHGKFALELLTKDSPGPLKDAQAALERLQMRGWVRLIDISPLPSYPGRLFRIFLATDEALTWRRSDHAEVG